MSRSMILPGAIFTLAGGIALFFAIYFAYEQWSFASSAVETEGLVIGQIEFAGEDEEPMYAPMVEWRDSQGTARRFQGQIGSQNPRYPVGDRVEISYDPAQPDDARLSYFWPSWMKAILSAILALAFVLGGAWLLQVYRNEGRRIARLQETGVPVNARLLYALPIRRGRMQEPLWRLVCTAKDPVTGGKRNFRTPPLAIHPSTVENAVFRVLVDPENGRNYHIDLANLLAEEPVA